MIIGQKNFGQAPMFQTTNQMTEQDYPTAADLKSGLERVDRLMAPTPAMDRWEDGRY